MPKQSRQSTIIVTTSSDEDVGAKLYDPRTAGAAFRLRGVEMECRALEPERTNYFSVFWIASGSGSFWADTAQHTFAAEQLLFFVPYQYIRFEAVEPVRATLLQFHANFLCVETFHSETGCSGSLFNDPFGIPLVAPAREIKNDIIDLLERMRREYVEQQVGYQEALLACMKLLLITATRAKASSADIAPAGVVDFRHPVLAALRDLIEQHYRSLHAPSDYAALLHVTPKTLGRIVREHLGKTLTDLIRERILKHAKWQLLHTLRPVKEIAAEIGFADELYFSRLFKKATGISPTYFRQFETEIRNGSNLSMS